jgi:hypothetical protein
MNVMQRILSILGYTWAALCLIVVLATFIGLGVWPKALAQATGVKVSPWYSGGEVAGSMDHGSYQTLVRQPVFDGLFAQRAEGFVQVDWSPKEHQALPDFIDEELDVDGNGTMDLRIRVNTISGATQLTPMQAWVLGAEKLAFADNERILRIRLRNWEN